jgi:hypothetical protein
VNYFKIVDEGDHALLELGKDFPSKVQIKKIVFSDKEAQSLTLEKWKFMEKYYEGKPIKVLVDGGTETCAFCIKYIHNYIYNFPHRLCPIQKKTGKPNCQGTPYDVYGKVTAEVIKEEAGELSPARVQELLSIIRAERKFLEGLSC